MKTNKYLQKIINNRFHTAVSILCEEYDIDANIFFSRMTRERNAVEARRFLIFYCYNELKIANSHILQYILILTNHATILHHIKVHKTFMKQYEDYNYRYNYFVQRIAIETEIFNYE